MPKNLLIRLARFPEKVYSDLQTLKNEYKIKNGLIPWPLECLYDIIWINPLLVVGTMYKKDRFPEYYRGRSLPGDWDKNFKDLKDSTAYKVLHKRYRLGMEWEQIFEESQKYRGFLDKKQIRKYREKARMRDELYHDLMHNGWKLSTVKKKSFLMTDELNVNVARDGSCIRNNSGLHRLVMARFLGLESVPCRIHVVHSEFLKNGTNPVLKQVSQHKTGSEPHEITTLEYVR